jgi:hypothetical protein
MYERNTTHVYKSVLNHIKLMSRLGVYAIVFPHPYMFQGHMFN